MRWSVGQVRVFTSPTGTINWDNECPIQYGEKFIMGDPVMDGDKQLRYAEGLVWTIFRVDGQRHQACYRFLHEHTRAVR